MLTKKIKASRESLLSATVRDFTGGWDVLDNDMNLSTKYAIKLFNVSLTTDNCISVRYGTQLFVDLTPYTSSPANLINFEYYQSALICVMSNGDVIRVLGDGSTVRIWDAVIAGALAGAPAGWHTTTFVSFAQFNNKLIICNGVDKPLIVSTTYSVDYLKDLATNTNLNTPVAAYVTTCDRYMVMAGDPVHPNRIHISARDTSGVYFGDTAPNDGTFLDVGSILPNSSIISGITSFRGQLIVGYPEGTLIVTLGNYDAGGFHTPAFDNPITQYGTVSHRVMQPYGDDVLMMDIVGVPSLKRTVFTGTLRPDRVSDLIDPAIHAQLSPLSINSLLERCWSVYNQSEGQFLFFVPNADTYADTTLTTAYVYTYRPSLKIAAWARFDGWNFVCGARSLQGALFFGDRGGKIWLYGSRDHPSYSDFLGDNTINGGLGVPITFDWELPWSDMNKRSRTKSTRYIELDTRGTAPFTVLMYCDRQLLRPDLSDAPQLSGEYVGGDVVGYGYGDQPFGAGRVTSYDKKWFWPAKFKLMKLRFRGQTTQPLKFVGVTLMFLMGGYNL